MIPPYDFRLHDFYTAMGIERNAKLINDFSPLYSYSLVFLLFYVRFLKDNQT